MLPAQSKISSRMIPTMNKPKVTDPSLSQQSIMSAPCRTPRLGGLFNINFLSSPFGHLRAAAGVTVRWRWVDLSISAFCHSVSGAAAPAAWRKSPLSRVTTPDRQRLFVCVVLRQALLSVGRIPRSHVLEGDGSAQRFGIGRTDPCWPPLIITRSGPSLYRLRPAGKGGLSNFDHLALVFGSILAPLSLSRFRHIVNVPKVRYRT